MRYNFCRVHNPTLNMSNLCWINIYLTLLNFKYSPKHSVYPLSLKECFQEPNYSTKKSDKRKPNSIHLYKHLDQTLQYSAGVSDPSNR